MSGRILAVNTGSATTKLAWFHEDLSPGARRSSGAREHEGDPRRALSEFMQGEAPIAVGHRVVHGGDHHRPACIEPGLIDELERLSPLAPNHNPVALAWIRAACSLWPAVPACAVFDTAFFAQLPEVARTYALPSELAQARGLRRYGFHGLAHEAMWSAYRALGRPERSRVVTLQLGGGCSAAAIAAGHAVDTSMGFTPLEGLVMASRSGDVDPGLLLWLLREGYDANALERLLSAESGLRGLSGASGDVRELLASADPRARLALDVFVWRAKKYLGAYLAVLGGADAVLLAGGIGEHSPEIRARLLRGFEWCGLVLDEQRNSRAERGTHVLHAEASDVEIVSVAIDEERALAEQASSFIGR